MIAYASIPALMALLFKALLLGYSVRSAGRNLASRLFVALLLVLAAQNLVEFWGFNYRAEHGMGPLLQTLGFAYVGFLIPALALILHISLRLSFDLPAKDRQWHWAYLLYLPAAGLVFLLLFTDTLVVGFQAFQDTVLRIPGPWYFLFETYLELYLLATLANLFYGARPSRLPAARTRNRLWLLALLPTALLFIYLIVANHFGWTRITSTFYIPITLTFFLAVTAYATHQYRLFDLEFYIPWSKARRRKTAFYQRIQATIGEFADLPSVDAALERVAEVLRCPVALVGGWRPVFAAAGEGSLELAQFPHDVVAKVDRIVVAREIGDARSDTYGSMQQFKVAAIVPFYPNARTAASWMLLGESFNESVYTPLDFRKVEWLFDNIGDFLLDKVGFLRAELDQASKENLSLRQKLAWKAKELARLNERTRRLTTENEALRYELRLFGLPDNKDGSSPG
jgi:hypothetical protein